MPSIPSALIPPREPASSPLPARRGSDSASTISRDPSGRPLGATSGSAVVERPTRLAWTSQSGSVHQTCRPLKKRIELPMATSANMADIPVAVRMAWMANRTASSANITPRPLLLDTRRRTKASGKMARASKKGRMPRSAMCTGPLREFFRLPRTRCAHKAMAHIPAPSSLHRGGSDDAAPSWPGRSCRGSPE